VCGEVDSAVVPPRLSQHYLGRKPSPIRAAQILAAHRPDRARLVVVNLAIGNVSLPMHPAMQERMRRLGELPSPFAGGAVRYTPSVGTDEARRAFLNVIASAGCSTEGLDCVVTDGGSMAMELMILGTAGPCGTRPILLLDPAYSNYADLARRVGARTISARRVLGDDSRYGMPDLAALDRLMAAERPAALVVIPADNPTGQLVVQETLVALARLCVAHDAWLVGDEAYRQLDYDERGPTSIWRIGDDDAPGIRGGRIGIESASKVFNACGLRVGALVTDSQELHRRALAEYTANLSSNAIGQWIFGALAELSPAELGAWYAAQRAYYRELLRGSVAALRAEIPDLVVSSPEAALYSVLDLRRLVPDGFDAAGFVRFCAERGAVEIDGVPHTLLLAPMAGFQGGVPDPAARTQLRLAYVEPPETMRKVPRLLKALLESYLG
jgi:aspartate aminotransferase